jgi:SPP1 gp7 family putative phage head morphogenesis protein
MVDKTNARAKAAGGYRVMQPIIKNKAADVYYRRAIEAETDKMLTAIFAKLERVYTTVKVSNAATGANKPSVSNIMKLITYYKKVYLPKFLRNAEKIIDKFINLATRNAKRSITKSMRQLYGDDFAVNWNGKDIDDILRLIIRRNVGLIENTTLQTLNNIENIVYDGVTTGQTWGTVAKDLSTQKHISSDRIKRIARDQTGKANEALNEAAQLSAGIEFFEWRTAEDERVSTGYGGHKQLDGKIYKWGDVEHYPIIDSYGHRGLPHERVNCRCTALAVILRKDYVAKQNSDGTWRIIKGRI